MGAAVMKPVYLLDSAILIDHLRGIPDATKWLQRLHEGEAVISVITRAEVMAGGTIENPEHSNTRLQESSRLGFIHI